MIDAMTLLTERNSAPRLTEPAPDAAAREAMFAAALRAPDHAWLRPWRFLTVEGEVRRDLGGVLERSLLRRMPDADAAAREKARGAPLRAPLVVVVLARLQAHPKVPPARAAPVRRLCRPGVTARGGGSGLCRHLAHRRRCL